jgi:hypothetical protein
MHKYCVEKNTTTNSMTRNCEKKKSIKQENFHKAKNKKMLVFGHPTDPTFSPRPYEIFSFFPKKKKCQHGKEILLPKYHDGDGYF